MPLSTEVSKIYEEINDDTIQIIQKKKKTELTSEEA